MNRIKELRKQKGMNQTELGKMLNVNNSAISKYESGIVQLTDDTLIKLSEIFDVSIDYILCINNTIGSRLSKEDQLILDIFHQDSERVMELLSSFSELSARNKTIILGKCFELEDSGEKASTRHLNKEKELKQAT